MRASALAILILGGCTGIPAPDIRRVTLSDGTIVFAKCGIDYPGAIADTQPPPSPCLDWEMARAGMSPR